MRTRPLIVASMTALLTLAASGPAHAQSQSNGDQSVPDAPQPQKKPAAKAQSSDSGSQAKDKSQSEPQASDSSSPPNDKAAPKPPPSTKDENPFPEDVSKDAAAKAQSSDSESQAKDKSQSEPQASDSSSPPDDKAAPKPRPSSKDENPFPEDVSKDAAAKAAAGSSASDQPSDSDKGAPKHSSSTYNPFPESVSRDAAKAAGNDPDQAPPAKSDIPAGVSSSQSTAGPDGGENEAGAPNQVPDPGRAKRDAEVADYYLKSRDYQGALLRYKDATTADPTNVEAIFGLAETQRMLNKNADAARNYQLYLEIVPNGPKAKQALKALKTLGSGG
jgi:tetratricopeptide repeat protein